jgi:threonine aldolase
VTQATEAGTTYSPEELSIVGETARSFGLKLHMDGARFANAVASLGVAPKEITWKRGVDVLCFGGTKNGTPVGDAVVFFNKELAAEFDYRCKQAGQLASKMRFLAAPWVGMLENGAWLRHAAHANKMAARLREGLLAFPRLTILFPTQANSVFVQMPPELVKRLFDLGWIFYNFIGEDGCRLMCSWDTTPEDVDQFLGDIKKTLAAESGAGSSAPAAKARKKAARGRA